MKIQRKTVELAEFKMNDAGGGGFSGYASTFGNFDNVREAVQKGAFQDTLQNFLRDGFVAVNHDWDGLPVATINNAYEDAKGLFIEGEFHSDERSQAARTVSQERLARGKSVKMSIGYRVLDAAPVKDGRLLKKLHLYEVSLVNVPANDLASVSEVKGSTFQQRRKKPVGHKDDMGMDGYLDEDTEARMTMAALWALVGAMMDEICEIVSDEFMDDQMKIDQAIGAIDEFGEIAERAVATLLPDLDPVAPLPRTTTPPPELLYDPAVPMDTTPETGMASGGRWAQFKRARETAQAQRKYGQSVSSDNHSTLTGIHEQMKGATNSMANFLTQNRPKSLPNAEPKKLSPAEMAKALEGDVLKTLLTSPPLM